jgi:hypothetical protein
MSAPLPMALYGLIESRLESLWNPFARLDFEFGDDDQIG